MRSVCSKLCSKLCQTDPPPVETSSKLCRTSSKLCRTDPPPVRNHRNRTGPERSNWAQFVPDRSATSRNQRNRTVPSGPEGRNPECSLTSVKRPSGSLDRDASASPPKKHVPTLARGSEDYADPSSRATRQHISQMNVLSGGCEQILVISISGPLPTGPVSPLRVRATSVRPLFGTPFRATRDIEFVLRRDGVRLREVCRPVDSNPAWEFSHCGSTEMWHADRRRSYLCDHQLGVHDDNRAAFPVGHLNAGLLR